MAERPSRSLAPTPEWAKKNEADPDPCGKVWAGSFTIGVLAVALGVLLSSVGIGKTHRGDRQ